MPIDREQALKQAEKLLRQGRLDAAIAEYGRVVAEYPHDWATANLLGDLHVRAGQIDLAAQQYTRIADHLAGDGFVAKASALYKKVLKLNPVHEVALLRSAELAAKQGLVADVRTCLNTLFQARLKRGDRQGARALAATRVSFDPADVVGRLDAARMLAEAGDPPGAAGELRAAGLTLEQQGRIPEATRALRESLRFDPEHDETRQALIRLLVEQGDAQGAGEAAHTAAQVREFIRLCRLHGHHEPASRALERLAELDPADLGVRLGLARRCLAHGDLDGAARWASTGADPETPDLALVLAEIGIRRGAIDDGLARVAALLAHSAEHSLQAVELADRVAADDPEAGASVLTTVVDAALARQDLEAARVHLRDFVSRVPGSVVALRKLIDVCVDGGFAADLHAAQLELTDALLERGTWLEAKAVAEDLVASDPTDDRHVARLTRALEGLGLDASDVFSRLQGEPVPADEPEPVAFDLAANDTGGADGVSLSADFTDLVADLTQATAPRVAEAPLGTVEFLPVDEADDSALPTESAGFDLGGAARTADGSRARDLAVVDDDLRRLFEDEAERPADAPRQALEIDLSGALESMRVTDTERGTAAPGADARAEGTRPAEPSPPDASADLDAFFQSLRDDADSDGRSAEAARALSEGQESLAAGQNDRAGALLRVAAREPACRLEAARLIARIAREHGDLHEAVEWLERGAEAPPPSADAWRDLLFELADTLDQAGETSRALAVLLELRAEAPGYPDLDARIAALSSARPNRKHGETP